MILKNIKLVIFDLDGVLVDTERISISCWIKAFEEFNHKLDYNIAVQEIGSNTGNREVYYKGVMGKDLPYEEIRKLYYEMLINSIKNDNSLLKKGAVEILNHLELNGVKKAVASSSYKDRVMESLKAANIIDRFDIIMCGDDVSKCKPDPEIHIEICKKLGIDINDAIIIEDSDIGAEAAFNADIKCILIPDLKEIPPEWLNTCYAVMNSLCELLLEQ